MYLPKPNIWEQQITTKVFHTSYNRTFSEIEVRGEKALIIVREYDWHGISRCTVFQKEVDLYSNTYKIERIAKARKGDTLGLQRLF